MNLHEYLVLDGNILYRVDGNVEFYIYPDYSIVIKDNGQEVVSFKKTSLMEALYAIESMRQNKINPLYDSWRVNFRTISYLSTKTNRLIYISPDGYGYNLFDNPAYRDTSYYRRLLQSGIISLKKALLRANEILVLSDMSYEDLIGYISRLNDSYTWRLRGNMLTLDINDYLSANVDNVNHPYVHRFKYYTYNAISKREMYVNQKHPNLISAMLEGERVLRNAV